MPSLLNRLIAVLEAAEAGGNGAAKEVLAELRERAATGETVLHDMIEEASDLVEAIETGDNDSAASVSARLAVTLAEWE